MFKLYPDVVFRVLIIYQRKTNVYPLSVPCVRVYRKTNVYPLSCHCVQGLARHLQGDSHLRYKVDIVDTHGTLVTSGTTECDQTFLSLHSLPMETLEAKLWAVNAAGTSREYSSISLSLDWGKSVL